MRTWKLAGTNMQLSSNSAKAGSMETGQQLSFGMTAAIGMKDKRTTCPSLDRMLSKDSSLDSLASCVAS